MQPRPQGAERPTGRDASPFALALGYVAAETALFGQPAIPPSEARQSIFFALLALVVLSAAYEMLRRRRLRHYQTIAIVLVLLPTISSMARPLAENAWSKTETIAWQGGIALAAAAADLSARPVASPPARAGGLDRFGCHSGGDDPRAADVGNENATAQLAGAAAAALLPGLVLSVGKRSSPFSERRRPGLCAGAGRTGDRRSLVC